MCLSYREISSVDVKVRKPHMCAWCSEKILPRSPARSRSYVLDGELVSDWLHPECFEALNESDYHDICEGWTPGDFERGIAA